MSGDLLIEAELTADYADVADNPARLNLETRKPRRKYKDNESGKQEKRNLGLPKHPQIYADFTDLKKLKRNFFANNNLRKSANSADKYSADYFSTVTAVLTELEMKQLSCAA